MTGQKTVIEGIVGPDLRPFGQVSEPRPWAVDVAR
jgi:hypothetical protein